MHQLIRTCLATACVYQFLPFFKWKGRRDGGPFSFWTNSASEDEENTLNQRKADRYFQQKNLQSLLAEADTLFAQGKYMDVYEILNRLKYQSNGQITWRIGRALYQMSLDQTMSDTVRREMVFEAHDLITSNVSNGANDVNTYTWLAIITHAKNGFGGTSTRAKSIETVKGYLKAALEQNPDDKVVLYLLGKLCYDINSLSWIQRQLSVVLYGTLPVCTHEEAYDYLIRANDSDQDNYYIPHLYMLGSTCMHLKQYFRARFYLNSAVSLPPRTSYERAFAIKAKRSLQKLDQYDLNRKNVLFELGMEN